MHFFILTVCLIHNNGSSNLFYRLAKLTAPYSVLISQDYGARPIEMTTGQPRSHSHHLQVHAKEEAEDSWHTLEPPHSPLPLPDVRWHNAEHLLALAASEENEELIYRIFEQVAQAKSIAVVDGQAIDEIRLVRAATLSFAQNQLYREGNLPEDDLKDTVLYAARIVSMPDGQVKLLPVLERTRRAVSLEDAR